MQDPVAVPRIAMIPTEVKPSVNVYDQIVKPHLDQGLSPEPEPDKPVYVRAHWRGLPG